MPFTPSHVAAVLPLRGLARGALPFAALAAGSMAPDLPYFVPPLDGLNRWTHTAAGMVSVDVVLGLVMWAVWRSIAPTLHELSPTAVRERWHPAGWPGRAWWGAPVAVAVGAATHLAWDEFTHPGRWATRHLDVLSASYPGPFGPLPGYQYAQYASGAIGLAALAWVALRLPRTPAPAPGSRRLARALPWLCLAAGVLGAVARVLASGGLGADADAMAFATLTGGLGAAGAALLLACWARAVVVGWSRAGGGATGQPGERDRGRRGARSDR
jgi:hypothetical protein